MIEKVTTKQIVNAFTPAQEISDVDKFAGRAEFVNDAYYGLLTDGANIAIVGGRGIGKSSLARQIINISEGDNSLLEKLSIPSDEQLDFLSIYLACGDGINTISDLLIRLLTTRNCLLDWIYDIPNATKELGKIESGFDIKIAKVGSALEDETTSSKAIQTHEIDVVFQNVLSEILKAGIAKNGILIVIDEFDQIVDPSGFAKLLKSLATNVPGVKFCVVGVAQDIQNLMKEHESSDRLFAGSVVNLPPMQSKELNEIIENAENSINKFITFNEESRDKLISLANGHPYIIHLIGKQALRSAYLEPTYEITKEYITKTLSDIAEKEADPVLEGRYKKAVASSFQREAVLKSMVEVIQNDGEILTTDAYKIAIEFEVDNPSQYVGHLVTDDYGAEIVKIRERYYRYKDSLFATYVKARPWLTNNK